MKLYQNQEEFVVFCKELLTNDFRHFHNQFNERATRFYKKGEFTLINQRYYKTEDKLAKVMWHMEELPEGIYDVYAWYPSIKDASNSVTYKIYSIEGIESTIINQNNNSEEWIKIGSSHHLKGNVNNISLCLGEDSEGWMAVGNVKFVLTNQNEKNAKNEKIKPYSNDNEVSILNINPTVCFYYDKDDKKKKDLLQLVQIDVENTTGRQGLILEINLDNELVSKKYLNPFLGVRTLEISIPDIPEAKTFDFILKSEISGKVLYRKMITLQPTPKYTLYMMETAHNDLGYENSVPYKAEYWSDWMDDAIELIEKNTYHDNPKLNYNYWFEHIWQFIIYSKLRPKSRMDYIKKLIDQKRLGIASCFTACHGQWGGGEQNARATYHLKQEIKNHYGIDIEGIWCNFDNPTPSWDNVRAAYDAGYKGIMLACNSFRGYSYLNKLREKSMNNVFYWQLPDGINKIPALINYSYPEGMNFHYDYEYDSVFSHSLVDSNIKGFVNDNNVKYPYDTIFTLCYWDNEKPNTKTYNFIKSHNLEFEYPIIKHNGSMEDFFEEIFSKYGEQGEDIIPTYSGELNNFSGDYCTINVNAHAAKNKAVNLTKSAEGLSTIISILDPNYSYPTDEFYEQYWKFDEFDEHCYPTGPEYGDFQFYSTLYYKSKGVFDFMLPMGKKLTRKALKLLGSKIRTTAYQIVMVYNGLAHLRNDIVELEAAKIKHTDFIIRDLTSGDIVKYQHLKLGKIVFFAENVPSFGYSTYSIEPATGITRKQPNNKSGLTNRVYNGILYENRFYAIKFSSKTGNIISIFDKEIRQELVKEGKEFNQFIFRHYKHGQETEFEQYVPTAGKIELIEEGEVATVFKLTAKEAESGASIEQFITLYHDLKRINFTNKLTEVDSMYEQFTADYYSNMDVRYRKNLFYGFPFEVNDYKLNACTSGGIIFNPDDETNKLWSKVATKDFITVQNWMNVSNNNMSVTLFTPDAPTLMYGDITYNNFKEEHKTNSSEIYSYFQSARIGPNGFLSPKETNFTVNYSITSGAGDYGKQKCDIIGNEISNPLIATFVEKVEKIDNHSQNQNTLPLSKSFITLSHDNIELSILKQAEQLGRGIIVRLREMRGQNVEAAEITMDFAEITEAFITDGAENNDVSIAVNQNKVRFSMSKYSTITIRLLGKRLENQAFMVNANALNDGKIMLFWEEIKDATGYNIYRNTYSGFIPNAYVRVGYTHTTSYIDQGYTHFSSSEGSGFAPGQTFYYVIEPVNSLNVGGIYSNETVVRLKEQNVTAPSAIKGLMAMQLKNLGNTYRVAIQWEKCPELDVAAFNIYRSKEKDFTPKTENKVSPFVIMPMFRGNYMEVYIDQYELEPENTYYYKVRAVDSSGNEQMYSPEVSVKLIRLS